MKVSQLAPAIGYPGVQGFVEKVLDMQFDDVRAMLQLPRPDIGIKPGCNFALVSSLCNLISGISMTIFKPPGLLHEVKSSGNHSRRAFRELVANFFPYVPPGANDFPEELYQLCRNPMAHSVGVLNGPAPTVFYARILDESHDDRGWSDDELENLERPDRPEFGFPVPGVVITGTQWTLHCDSFYLDVIELLRRLNADATQMTATEQRFAQGVYNWRV